MSTQPVNKGKKLYNPDWQYHPVLKTWIKSHPTNNGKAFCYFCSNQIRAQKNDLMEHSHTRKHKMNFRKKVGHAVYFQYCKELARSPKKARGSPRSKQASKSEKKSSTTLPFKEKSAIELNCQPEAVPIVIVLDDDEETNNGSFGGVVPKTDNNANATSTTMNCDSGMEMESVVGNRVTNSTTETTDESTGEIVGQPQRVQRFKWKR
ncbi:unnamed protein product [Orchesella dallaii]|uniref:BED-type domain-containing protein n=1 Tax=Orchesella dallaii TaxID=48710 RepID=A0ABP1QD87_9HEXA